MKKPKRKTISELDKEGASSFLSTPEDVILSEYLKLHRLKPLNDDQFDYKNFYEQNVNAFWYTLKTLDINKTHDSESLAAVINYFSWISALNHYQIMLEDYREAFAKLYGDQYLNAERKASSPNAEELKNQYLKECVEYYEPDAKSIEKIWEEIRNIKIIEPPENPLAEMFNRYQKLDPDTHKTQYYKNDKHEWLKIIENLKFETKPESWQIDIKIPAKHKQNYINWIFVTNLIATGDAEISKQSIVKNKEKYYIPIECYLYLEQLLPVLTYAPTDEPNPSNPFVFIPDIKTLIK